MGNLPPKNLFFPQGKIGNLVFYSMNGKTVVRTRPSGTHRNKTHPSPLQLLQREKLKTINRFLKPLKRVLDFGYQEYLTQSKKGIHLAYAELNHKGYHHDREPRIDPAFLKISKGNLLEPQNPTLEKTDSGFRISWDASSAEGKSMPSDETFIVLYQPEQGKYIWVEQKFRRSAGLAEVNLAEANRDYPWHVYLAFSQYNIWRKSYILSNSEYLGKIEL
ncbi:DUF6266 family protein [Algoriphagus hitonicola]|uniref:DUF6266 family protein n=1 Tax=Algoriphagus hitonicola TaxID=435880 RepID=UPI00360E4E5D